jgi:uncharacterized protein (TIGR03086 family)
MEPLAALARATDELERRLGHVADDQWSLSTPCTDWTVRDLADHVIGGNRFAVLLLAGATTDEAFPLVKASDFSGSTLDHFLQSSRAQAQAFTATGALELLCDHPWGPMPGLAFLGHRVTDLTVHAWDLARAIGADESLDPDLVETVYATRAASPPDTNSLAYFGNGPSGHVGDDAPTQQRLLDLLGRRP